MTVTDLDTQTDFYAKTNTTMFPLAEKLAYYNEAHGILNGLIIARQEDRGEIEETKTTIAGQREYHEMSRIHHINWLKINYGDGFIPARYKAESDLIAEYGTDLETVLTQWDKSDPIYFYKGSHFFVIPAPSASQAGADRLKASVELLPVDLDRSSNTTPLLVPANFHFLHAVYAAWQYHNANGEESQAAIREKQWNSGVALMLDTMTPRAREAEIVAHVPDDDGSSY